MAPAMPFLICGNRKAWVGRAAHPVGELNAIIRLSRDRGMMMKFEHPLLPLVGRLLMTYIYLTSGLAKVVDWSGNEAYMARHHVPMVPVLLFFATIIELGGSLCLITGFQARWAALIMFGYTLVLTLLLHNYWAGDPSGMQETHFRKNLAIMGGLLLLAHGGPGRWALHWPRRDAIASTNSTA